MTANSTILLCSGFFVIAICYTAVGQAGATGYLALMALVSMMPAEMRTTALLLNIIASGYASVRFGVAGHLRWSTLRPFMLASVPLAAIGGAISLNPAYYRVLTGLLLACAAVALIWRIGSGSAHPAPENMQVPARQAIVIGAVIGFLSGVTGVGGGILLGPALLALRWAAARQAAGVSAPFNLVNSAIALTTGSLTTMDLPRAFLAYGASVLAGAIVGTQLSVRRMPEKAVIVLLASLTAIGAVKLLIDH